MKRISILLLALLGCQHSFAQLLGGEKVQIHGIEFKAKEVVGQNNFGGPPDSYRTKISKELVTKRSDDFYIDLGSFRRVPNDFQTIPLFNLSLQNKSFPLLDSIDFDYYTSYGFDEVEKNEPKILEDANYRKFKAYIIDSTMIPLKKKKQYLFSAPSLYRNMLLMSRYEILKSDFTVDSKKISKITADLKAQLDTIKVSTNAEVSAKARAYFRQLADKSTKVKGYYVDARLHPFYINKISYYIKKTSELTVGSDEFALNLRDYVFSTTAAANTSLGAIQLSGTFDATTINTDSISSELSSRYSIPAPEAIKIAASAKFTFEKNEERTFKNKFNNLFIVRYFTSSVIDDLEFLRSQLNKPVNSIRN